MRGLVEVKHLYIVLDDIMISDICSIWRLCCISLARCFTHTIFFEINLTLCYAPCSLLLTAIT